MKTQVNDFTSFELTEEEALEAVNFTSLQRAFMQNLLSEAAHSKVNLTFDPQNPSNFLQHEAELQGKIGILKYLLSMKELTEQQQ